MSPLTEIGGRRLPFLRWSFIRLLVGMKKLTTEWQVGDGREERLAEYVTQHAQGGDVDDAIRGPVEARSSTAQTRLVTECSPGSRPMTLTRRRVSPKVRRLRRRASSWCGGADSGPAARTDLRPQQGRLGGERRGAGCRGERPDQPEGGDRQRRTPAGARTTETLSTAPARAAAAAKRKAGVKLPVVSASHPPS